MNKKSMWVVLLWYFLFFFSIYLYYLEANYFTILKWFLSFSLLLWSATEPAVSLRCACNKYISIFWDGMSCYSSRITLFKKAKKFKSWWNWWLSPIPTKSSTFSELMFHLLKNVSEDFWRSRGLAAFWASVPCSLNPYHWLNTSF